ncbi:hypothetical protein RI054_43g151130 [Pseudoscourfieldia marina]
MSDANDNTTTDDRKRLIDEFWAAEKKVGPPEKVEISRMVFSKENRTRDKGVADKFIAELPLSASRTYATGSEQYRLSDLYRSLEVRGWDNTCNGFALKSGGDGENVKYTLLAGNTRYLMLSYLASENNNNDLYKHGWVRLVADKNDACVIALGHNLISETVRPPPELPALTELMLERLQAMKGSPKDWLRELGVGLQHNVASFVKKVLHVQTEVNAYDNKDNACVPAKTLVHELMAAVAKHIARLKLQTKASTSSWAKINPKDVRHDGEPVEANYCTLVDPPPEGEKVVHFKARLQAYILLATPTFGKLSKTQSDVNWLILHLESAYKEGVGMPQEVDVRAALQSRLQILGVQRGVPAANTAGASEAMDELAAAAAAAAAADGPQQDNASQAPEDHSLAKTAANACTHCSYCSQETPWHCPECLNRRATCIYICSPQTGRPCFSRHCQGGRKKARKGSI